MRRHSGRPLTYSYFIAITIGILIISASYSLAVGAVKIDLWQNFPALWGDGKPNIVFILQSLRLPRTLLAILVGAILGICGAVLQGLFRNPLADPAIIGVSAGAALGAGIAIVLLPSSILLWQKTQIISLFAFAGGLLATLLVYHIGKTSFGTKMTLILLAGIAIGSLAFAFLGLLQFFADDSALRELTTWQLGSVANADNTSIALCFLALVLVFIVFQRQANALNALLLGDIEARHLGVEVERIKRHCIYLTAFAIGIAVSVAGIIGFIGLVVPHICRTLLGSNHQTLLPASALVGAIVLLIADILARVLVPPAEIPVGILTALLGSPFFIALLSKNKSKL